MIDVWLTDPAPLVDDLHLRSAYLALLSEDERARYERFVFPEHRHTYLVAHALVRTTLSRYHRTPPKAWKFSVNQYGRPDVAFPETAKHLVFNLSHTDGLVAVGVAQDMPLGIDVEDRSRRSETLSVASRFFAPSEVAELFAAPKEQQPRLFFDFWTLKEAYIKARGMGLHLPLSAFAFSLRGDSPKIRFDHRIPDDDPDAWRFVTQYPTARHTLSVAVKEESIAVAAHWCVPLNEDRRR